MSVPDEHDPIEHFIRRGYAVVRGALPRELTSEWTAASWARMGYDPRDPRTWKSPMRRLRHTRQVRVKEAAPRAWRVICELLGGPERVQDPDLLTWRDDFIVNLAHRGRPDWHLDGAHRRWHLDSREFGLLVLIAWSDIRPGEGGTLLAVDSIAPISRRLLAHPEGLPKSRLRARDAGRLSRDVVEMTGSAGDVYLVHPFMSHSAAKNLSGRPRFLSQCHPALAEPMRFDPEPPQRLSPVERVILGALGAERLDFRRAR